MESSVFGGRDASRPQSKHSWASAHASLHSLQKTQTSKSMNRFAPSGYIDKHVSQQVKLPGGQATRQLPIKTQADDFPHA